ncbi:MAG: glycoside hydrolase family 16 protein [Mariniphaga sp.]
MKTIRPASLFLFVILCCSLPDIYASDPPSLYKPGWKLTFHDEFDGPNLNDLYWYTAYRTGRLEYLNRIGAEEIFYDPNAEYKIENGILKLIIDKNIPARRKIEDHACSCIVTSDHRFGETTDEYQILEKFSQKYGWFEIRCKTVAGSGIYTAFWLHQTDPNDQEYTPEGVRRKVGDGVVEIDIFEQWSWKNINETEFAVHFTDNPNRHHICKLGFDPAEDYHVYALEWKEGELNWYVDGNKVHTYIGDTPQKKMFILAAIFHRPDRERKPLSELKFEYPKEFEIDYIRVYLPEE